MCARARAFAFAHVYKYGWVYMCAWLCSVEGFDNDLYGINDYEASQMDPQQCLLLDCTHMALQDAGFTRKQISGSRTGVYIGS